MLLIWGQNINIKIKIMILIYWYEYLNVKVLPAVSHTTKYPIKKLNDCTYNAGISAPLVLLYHILHNLTVTIDDCFLFYCLSVKIELIM